jgi:hypothetical protein
MAEPQYDAEDMDRFYDMEQFRAMRGERDQLLAACRLPMKVWIVLQDDDGRVGVRGVHASAELARAGIAAIIAEHPDLKSRFSIQVEQIRGNTAVDTAK